MLDNGMAAAPPMMASPIDPAVLGSYGPSPLPPSPEQLELFRRLDMLARLASLDNAAEDLDETELAKLGSLVCREYKIDRDSRDEWEQQAQSAMDMARQKRTSKSFPWPNASNVKFPLLTTAALQFAARAYPAIVDGPRIVKGKVLGRDLDGQKAAAADRVGQHISYQLLYEVPGWETDVDTALHQIPIVGCAFKKIYPDPLSEAGFADELVSAFDFVVHQRTKSLETVPRATHVFTLYPHQIAERQRAGMFLDGLQLDPDPEADGDDPDAPRLFLEQHRYWDSDGDGMAEPWVVTVHQQSEKVVRLRAAYDLEQVVVDEQRGRILKLPKGYYCRFVKLPFLPDPEGGFYDIGFGRLLHAVSDVIDSTINQLMDAGTLQNAGGGFVSGTLQLGKSKITFRPGEYHRVDGVVGDIRQSLVNMQHPGPAPVLFQLLELMINAGKDIASVKDILTGETPVNQTATSTMAAIEQGLKVFTAIYKRIFRALSEEYSCIYEINKRTLDGPKYVALLDEPIEVTQADYQGEMDVVPTADPNSVTDMQRMAKAQLVLEEGKSGNPHVNVFAATKRAFEAARVEAVDEVLIPPPPPDQPLPPNPAEQAAQIKMQELQAGAEIKQQSAQMDLQARQMALQMDLARKQADLEAAEQQLRLKVASQHQEAALREAELERRWRELDLKEAAARQQAEAARGSTY
jgi:chaperonin GroES